MKTNLLLLACLAIMAQGLSGPAPAASMNGAAGQMPAYYDHQLFTINFKELPAGGERANLLHNSQINFIFVHDDPLPDGSPFISVIDAIQGDGFNPLWVEVEIEFTPGHAPRQLFSDDEIEAALDAGEITFSGGDEVYRCSVVGPGPKQVRE